MVSAYPRETQDHGPLAPYSGVITQVIDPQVGQDDDDPSKMSLVREAMGEKWELPNALMGGTRSMRLAGRKYLPQETAELDPAYHNRLQRSFLLNAYRDAVDSTAGKPFTRDIVISESTAQELKDICKDIDLRGQTLTQFAAGLMKHGWHYGLAHFMVDYPVVTTIPTILQERTDGLRPFFVQICPEDVLGWRSARINGTETLTQLRIREDTVEPSGQFGDQVVCRIRVWSLHFVADETASPGQTTSIVPRVTWVLYRKSGQVWGIEDDGSITLDRIPFVTFYVARTGFMTADPPLEDLAWVNQAHWQSASDQRNILRFARCATLFGAGIDPSELTGTQPIGANIAIFAKDPQARMQMVEHSGAAIGAGHTDLEALKEEMVVVGLQPQLRRTGEPTATAVALDTATSDSPLVASTRHLEQALELGLEWAARWMEIETDKTGVDITEDFGLSIRGSRDIEQLLQMRSSRDISRTTLFEELRRRGVLPDRFDTKKEEELLANEIDYRTDPKDIINKNGEDVPGAPTPVLPLLGGGL